MIPQEYIDELIKKIDLVSLIGAELHLSKVGANYSGACPFHKSNSEKSSGSFTVSPKKRVYHCFACGAHGSAIGFCMEYKGLGFVEAVDFLAAKAGMPAPSMTPSDHAVNPSGVWGTTRSIDLCNKAHPLQQCVYRAGYVSRSAEMEPNRGTRERWPAAPAAARP